MTIQELMTQSYETTEPDTRAGKLSSRLEKTSTDAVIVVDDGVVEAVQARDLVRSRLSDDAEARALSDPIPTVEFGTGIREIARLLVENDTAVAAVVDQGDLHGVVTRDRVLDAVSEDLSAIDIADVHTQDPVTVDSDESMGEVINDLRDRGISMLPVLEDGRLAGVATGGDLVEFVVRATDTVDRGDRGGDKPRLLDLPVENVMSRPATTATPSETVQSAVETMFERDYDGLVVVDESSSPPGEVVGVLTKTDVLRALSYTDAARLDVQVTNPDLLRTVDREELVDRIEGIVAKYQDVDVIHAHVTFQKHDETHRGESLIRCQVRLFTDKTQLAGTGEGYGAGNALSLALDKLERNVLELKGKESETARREHLVETLQSL